MDEYRHHVSGFFTRYEEAESVFSRLVERGIPLERVQIFVAGAGAVASDLAPKEGSNEVLKDVVVDGTVGVAVGTGLGALGSVALVVADVSLFVASPLIAPLVMLGWGASLGGLVGAVVGATASSESKEGWFSDLIGDAIASGQVVLVVETQTQQETVVAQEVIKASVGDSKDTNMA